VWGGAGAPGGAALSDGAAYDLAADGWSALAEAGAPSSRESAGAVWTGSEMIVWGGWVDGGALFGDGARYRLADDTWSPVSPAGAPAARARFVAQWMDGEMLVWGGCSAPLCYQPDPPGAGIFDKVFGDGARYDPATDSWTPVSSAHSPRPRHAAVSVWTGSEVLLDGGMHPKAGYFSIDDGGRYCAPASGTPAAAGICDGLALDRVGAAGVHLQWLLACGSAADYAVYEGTLGNWYDHEAVLCSTGGATTVTVTPRAGDRYFLMVPLTPAAEGSYGTTSGGAERPAPLSCRLVQETGGCP